MISLAVMLLGLQRMRRQKLRIRQLSQCVELIQTVAVEIRYGCIPIKDILRSAAQNEAFSSLGFLQNVREDTLAGFSEAWKRSVEATPTLAMKPEEKAVLIRFGNSLGTTDTQTQLILCDRYRSQLSGALERAAARQTEALRLIVGGTVITALTLFALIL